MSRGAPPGHDEQSRSGGMRRGLTSGRPLGLSPRDGKGVDAGPLERGWTTTVAGRLTAEALRCELARCLLVVGRPSTLGSHRMPPSHLFRSTRAGFFALTTLFTTLSAAAEPPAPRPADAHPGCFVLMDLETGQGERNDAKACAKRRVPASTFKVPHALIALETGVVSGPDEVRKWDGTKHSVEMWNQDQTLDTAMRRSALWFFQGTAKQLGRKRMEEWLKRFRYGNADASSDITRFWLGGPLRVSADEQLDFLARMYRGELPVSPKTLEAVKATLAQGPDTVASTRDGINMGGPWKDGAVLSAKTGTYPHAEGDTTWLVGHVASPRGRHVFVSVVQAPAGKRVSPHPALASAVAALKARGLL